MHNDKSNCKSVSRFIEALIHLIVLKKSVYHFPQAFPLHYYNPNMIFRYKYLVEIDVYIHDNKMARLAL